MNEIVAPSHLFSNTIKEIPVLERGIFRDKAWVGSLSLAHREVSFVFTWDQGKEGKQGEFKIQIELCCLQDFCQSLRTELSGSFEPYLPATCLYQPRYLLR
jgi:hypothetical protein